MLRNVPVNCCCCCCYYYIIIIIIITIIVIAISWTRISILNCQIENLELNAKMTSRFYELKYVKKILHLMKLFFFSFL